MIVVVLLEDVVMGDGSMIEWNGIFEFGIMKWMQLSLRTRMITLPSMGSITLQVNCIISKSNQAATIAWP